jgi:8-oxo-dGTP pyrophosphatase MutT (NUDIX family)
MLIQLEGVYLHMTNKQQDKKERIAVIPIVLDNEKLRVYLITSREQRRWIIPTGKPERKLSNRQVAALEAFEEAGILGKIDKNFSERVLLHSPSGKHERKTTVFLLYVKRTLKLWPEIRERKRKLVSIKKYLKSISNKKFKRKVARNIITKNNRIWH